MTEATWIGLTSRERALLLDALVVLRRRAEDAEDIDALTIKLVHSAPHPKSPSVFTAGRCNGLWEIHFRYAYAITTAQPTKTFPISTNAVSDAGCAGSRLTKKQRPVAQLRKPCSFRYSSPLLKTSLTFLLTRKRWSSSTVA
jgi:hypothetical protein